MAARCRFSGKWEGGLSGRGFVQGRELPNAKRFWFRGLDSNQDNQIQSLVAYRLADPGTVKHMRVLVVDQPS